MLVINILTFALSCGLLIVSGIYLVKSLSRISRILGISEFSTAFIIMAFATSIPELFVGVSSALSGTPSLSLGNVIGANIINLTLVTGIIAISAKKIRFKSRRIGGDTELMLFSIVILIALYVIGNGLSRVDGAVLICLFLFHTYRILKRRKKYKGKIVNGHKRGKRFVWLFIFLLALVGLFISSNFVVQAAKGLAVDLNFPSILIGIFLLGIATTLPEMVFGISASKLRHKVMAIGDQIGTIVTNATLIIGIVALISPISVEFMPFLISALFMFIAAFIFVTFIKTGHQLEKMEGISLIMIFILFIIIEFFVK
jgi:cation:H+ antiporter